MLCEKAITVNSAQLQEIITLAQQKQVIVAEAMMIYPMPLYKKLKSLVQSGTIGKLKMTQVSFSSCK